MPPIRAMALLGVLAAMAWAPALAAPSSPAKYYFRIGEAKVPATADPAVRAAAQALLEKELAGRPEFTSDVGGAAGDAALVAELKKRKLDGFNLSLRIDDLKREVKPPKPGGRLKQLAVNVRLSVFGTTLPGEKLAFAGDGEAGLEGEIIERRLEEEGVAMLSEAMAQAIRQALDQAVAKLSAPKSVPLNEGKRKRKKK